MQIVTHTTLTEAVFKCLKAPFYIFFKTGRTNKDPSGTWGILQSSAQALGIVVMNGLPGAASF